MRYSILLFAVSTSLLFFATNLAAEAQGKISYQRKLDDNRIERDFADGLRWVDSKLDKSETRARAFNGYVLLYGSVDNASLAEAAEKHANRLNEVRRVFNQLQIGIAPPSWLDQKLFNAKIRSNLLASADFDSSKIKFESLHGTVYLMGLVSSMEAAAAVDVVSNIAGVEEIVTLFEYLD